MWRWIKIPKAIALLAFFLPWMTVSCSGQTVVRATGFGLAFGHIEVMGGGGPAGDGHISIVLILALIVIASGLALSLFKEPAPRRLLATSGLGILLVWIGTSSYSKSALLEKAAEHRNANTMNSAMDKAAMAMIRVDWHIGFWIAVLALVASGVIAWIVLTNREEQVRAAIGRAASSASEAVREDAPAPVLTRTCSICGHRYGGDVEYCPKDGTALE